MWFMHVVIYVLIIVAVHSSQQSSFFWSETTIFNFHVGAVIFLTWLIVLVIHGLLSLSGAAQTYEAIREIKITEQRQHELEILRLQIELERVRNPALSDDTAEEHEVSDRISPQKPKRSLRLHDR